MKTKTIILLLTFFVCSVSTAKTVNDAEAVYHQLNTLFPQESHTSGHSSISISFEFVNCYFSTSRSVMYSQPLVTKTCYAKSSYSGKTYTITSGNDDLIFTLMLAGYPVDTVSEPGTTYVNATNVNCMAAQPVGSGDDATYSYSCDDIL